MKVLFKKTAVCLMAVAMTATTLISVGAQNQMSNMKFAGYDVTDPYNPNRIYNEVIDGEYTNKQILVPVEQENIIWKAEGYEAEFPYAGYSRLYLDGKQQDVIGYNSLFPQWETRRKDFMWELKSPYYIYERQQTKVNNKTWTWDYGSEKFGIADYELLTKTVKKANILDISYNLYGFGKYDAKGNNLALEQKTMYDDFGITAVAQWDNLVANVLTVEKLSEVDANGLYKITDAMIADVIPTVYDKIITGKFNTTNNDGLCTKDSAAEYLKHRNDGWQWDGDVLVAKKGVTVEWTAPEYEIAEPYYYYQYLVVNGVVLDGSLDANGVAKDRIFRYTGAKASPEVKWQFAFFQNYTDKAGVLHTDIWEVVEVKLVDGKVTNQYRVPTGKYGNTFIKKNGTALEYWVEDAAGHAYLLKSIPNAWHIGGHITGFNSVPEYQDIYLPETLIQ